MEPQALLLQRADEAFDDPVTLRLADERGAVGDAQPGEFVPKRVRRVLRPPVAPDREPAGDVLLKRSVREPDALVHWLESRPPITDLRHVPPDDVGARVVDGAEPPAPALLGRVEPGGVGAPQDVGRVVVIVPVWAGSP